VNADLYGQLIYLGRAVSIALLFISAGTILAVNRPHWPGSWLLLAGAILSSALAAVRLLGLLPSESVWSLLAFEAAETLSYLLAGVGIVLVSMKARTIDDESSDVNRTGSPADAVAP
jgi:hypothetical protein